MSVNVSPRSEQIQEVESKINLLNVNEKNTDFIEHVKTVMEYVTHFDVAFVEQKILARILPAIENRFHRVFSDNHSMFETLDDELMTILIRENLEVILQLTEIIQELLHFIGEHSPVEVADIESILRYLPRCIQLFAGHWKDSSEGYKNAFMEELSKIIEVMKHLFTSFLYLLKCSVADLQEGDKAIDLLVDALALFCEMPKLLCDVDANNLILNWKCFGAVVTKYSSVLDGRLDVRVPVKILTENICQIMEALIDHDMEALQCQLKIIHFLTKFLFKFVSEIFYQQLNNVALELLMFYIRVLCFSPEYYKCRNFSTEALLSIESCVFKDLDEFLHHLITDEPVFKDQRGKLLGKLDTQDICKKYPTGFLNFLNKILKIIICDVDSEWQEILIDLVENIFDALPSCRKELFMLSYEDGIYQQLIINISAAILLHDANCGSMELLLKNILQDNVFTAILALEIHTLVVSNIPTEDCLSLLISLLYGVTDLTCGLFTHTPEIVYLKILLQRMLKILPNVLKAQVVKLFHIDQYAQLWRFLGFGGLPADQVQLVLDPVIRNTSHYITSIDRTFNEEMAFNIAECLELIFKVEDGIVAVDPTFLEISSFMETFWSSNIDKEMMNNNILKYFVSKIATMTASCLVTSSLNPELVFPKLKLLSCNRSYWVSIYKITSSILKLMIFVKLPLSIKQGILSQIADTIPVSMENSTLISEIYFEMLRHVSESHNDNLNILLDNLNAKVANQIFEYIDKFRRNDYASLNTGNLAKEVHFTHICLKWNNSAPCDDEFPPIKKFKFEDKPNSDKCKDVQKVKNKKLVLTTFDDNAINEDDSSSATEVIERLNGEVKCLLRVCKTEKLSPKDVAKLRILMSKMSSLM